MIFSSLSNRRRQPEWMDEPDADPVLVAKSLGFIRWINRLFGYNRATLSHLDRFSRRWQPSQRIDILDIATGSGDVPAAILRWAKRRNHNVHLVGLDRHRLIVRTAAEHRDSHLKIIRADALRLPFADNSFDYALTSMFLHHLSEDEVAAVLREMNRVSRRGIIVADLLRHQWAYAWISALTLFANPMVRNDARVSVAQAFVESEVMTLRDRAGIEFAQYAEHFGHRFILSGEKNGEKTIAH